jgi:hypothetical protein
MKDLDFDELDRAVNSLMTKTPDSSEPSASDGEKTLTLDSKAPVPSSSITPPPVVSQAAPVSRADEPVKKSSSNTPVSQPSVASRRGRFMDVVRPGASKPAEPSRPVSRQGATVQPSGPLVADIVPSTSPSPPVAKNEAPIVQQAPAAEKPAQAEWPDPLDMIDDTKPEQSGVSQDKDTDMPLDVGTPTGHEPLATPFLRDTKVEKRPLGAKAPQPEQKDLANEDAAPVKEPNSDAASQLPANPTDTTAPAALPEELSGDVMALESDANTVAMPAQDVTDKAVEQVRAGDIPEPKPEDTSPQAPEPEPKEEKSPMQTPPAEPIVPPGPISIPQQYRESPDTGDKENAAIYDTEAYHQPLAHPAKKKSGWLWVLWIVLILALGAGGGAALYFLGVF